MNNSDPELLINKIGKCLPFIYPTYGVYKISFLFFFASLSNMLLATIAVTIIKSWKTSNYLNSSYFKVVVFGSFIDILSCIVYFLYILTTDVSIVVEYLEENANIPYLVSWMILLFLGNWTYNMQDMNFFFISIIRFLSVFYPNNYYQYIEENYIYFQISLVIYSAILPLLDKIYCSLPYNYIESMYFNGAKKGTFICKYLFGYTYKEEHFISVALVHSLIVISIILTIMTIYKIKKLNKTSNESSVIAVKKRNKEKRMTRYVIIIGIIQLIRLIEEHFYYIELNINGYDESISYIMIAFDPFVGVFWIFLNAISIISISKTLRDAVFKNLKVDILYKKLFKENVVAPSSHNPNIIQSVNRGIKNKTLI